jgi:Protein of unknown function (DUF2442)
MIEIVAVTEVEPLGDYRLRLSFSDGFAGIHDFSDIVAESGPMAEPLRHKEFFKSAFIRLGVLTWPNGFDLDAIQLHREMQGAGELTATAAG